MAFLQGCLSSSFSHNRFSPVTAILVTICLLIPESFSVAIVSLLTMLQLLFFTLCPSLTIAGHTLLFVLPLVFLPLKVAPEILQVRSFYGFPNLPSAQETAKLLITHIFRLQGIPQDSDQGPSSPPSCGKPFVRL